MKSTLIAFLLAALLPAAASAQTATAYAERSEVLATGQEIHLYGLSTKDVNGKIRCYDVTATLPIADNGKPGASAPVTSTACPKVNPQDFVPGSYGEASGYWACNLQSSPFAGRTRLDMYCHSTSGTLINVTYTWYTGPIAGSPLEPQLVAAHLDTLPGNDQYSWGIITASNSGSSCIWFNALFSARENAGHLDLQTYGSDIIVECGQNYVKTTP